ncbi:MAG: phospho-sugar mutase [Deltaproteobacteria bacterium]|jgi:phosphoglucomutase/phosphomannomutase|nr:phospho-sugar mutase [Deltaproteobacteria bacterium]
MIDAAALLKEAKAGYRTLNVSEKYVDSALKWLEVWLTDHTFEDYVPQIRHLIKSGKWNFLLDSFYQIIPFGTGGRRGLVGIGPNRINPYTIQASAQGHSQYLIKQFGEEAKTRGIVLAFDVRKYTQQGIYDDTRPNPVMNLDGFQLAEAAATVYAANDLKVYMFETIRTTPELSFAIRHLNAISGDMFSASHNLPTDNGKKVYDRFGGQLIPPDDQTLVNEVTKNVKEIKTLAIDEARDKGLLEYIGEKVDAAYYKAVYPVSLSKVRDLKIIYSPLHGTGLTSVYPILKKLGFDVTLDPQTSSLSGAFENVTFNIPNPEVIESFDKSLPYAKEVDADILISTDPDADRIGVMLKHKDSWQFLTGNEIGIILTDYAISKYASKGRLNQNSVIIKTEVTTSLIEKIARENGIQCIGNLLVGFKYIADVMNKLEVEGRIDDFIFGTEESHGYLTGNYARDKDAAPAAVWLAEHAAELKKQRKTLLDDLNDIYARYGYCHNYLTEIRLLGAKGMEQISHIMDHLRNTSIEAFGSFTVIERFDRWQGEPQPHLSKTDTSARNVIVYYFENLTDTSSIRVTARPSGTEPKIKMYFEVVGRPCSPEMLEDEKHKVSDIRLELEKAFMLYCYKLLNVDFPDRGFLLFWQLPLDDKLKYFEIEQEIANLKNISDTKNRKKELDQLLLFLGANPVEKIDKAFREKFKVGVLEFLDL